MPGGEDPADLCRWVLVSRITPRVRCPASAVVPRGSCFPAGGQRSTTGTKHSRGGDITDTSQTTGKCRLRGVTLTEDLEWTEQAATATKKVHQHLDLLRRLIILLWQLHGTGPQCTAGVARSPQHHHVLWSVIKYQNDLLM